MSDSFASPYTTVHQTPLSMGFPRQEYWNGLPFPSPGDLPDPGIELQSPALQADSIPSEPLGKLESQERRGAKKKEAGSNSYSGGD